MFKYFFFFSRFRLKLHFLCLFVFLLFSLLRFDFTIYFYIVVLYSVFGKNKLGISIIDQTRKTAFTEEFLTAADTLYRFGLYVNSKYLNSHCDRNGWPALRYFNFEASLKMQWCCAQDLIEQKFQWPQEESCSLNLILFSHLIYTLQWSPITLMS